MADVRPELDDWLPNPSLRVAHRRASPAAPEALWEAARSVRLSDTRRLGRLVRWRIPGTPPGISFDELFRTPPFLALEDGPDGALVSGLVGRIWTLRRDYPRLAGPEDFRGWSRSGTARVVFGNWVEPRPRGGATLCAEVRVEAFGAQGRLGVAAVRPLVAAFHGLIASDGIDAALRSVERGNLSEPRGG